jgi:hypothetical protein
MLAKIATIIMILCLMPVYVFAASAIGQKANYADSWPPIDYETENTVSVGVHDQRPYVVNGEKSPTYAGAVRALLGNPWDVNTQSDKPLSDDIASAVVSGFKRMGTQAEIVSISFSDDHQSVLGKLKPLGTKRIVVITLREWRSESYRSAGFFIDAILQVYDSDERELAVSSTSHKNIGSGDGSVESTFDAARLHLSILLNDPKVKAALIQSNTSGSAEITKPNIPPQTNSETEAKRSDSSQYVQKLRELKKLKDEGLLTDKEYEQKRKSIIDAM